MDYKIALSQCFLKRLECDFLLKSTECCALDIHVFILRYVNFLHMDSVVYFVFNIFSFGCAK
jgi:hypothetical protein